MKDVVLDTDGHATEGLERNVGIDPFSTRYWEPDVKSQPVKAAATASESTTKMPPPPAPANAFAALGSGAANATASAKLVKAELLNDFKQAILDNRALSKVGIIDFIFHQFRNNVSRAEVKNTLEHVAEKKGTGRTKEWDLKPGHEIVL
jgi:chromatin assembly factor 1 subunit A